MTDEFDDEFEDEEQEQPQQREPLDPKIRKQLRDAKATAKELAELKVELASTRLSATAGLAGFPNTPLANIALKGYEGEVTTEALRKYGEELGLVTAAPPSAEELQLDSELVALRRAQGATIGSSGTTPDPEQEFLANLSNASTEQEVMDIVRGDSAAKLGVYTQRGAH